MKRDLWEKELGTSPVKNLCGDIILATLSLIILDKTLALFTRLVFDVAFKIGERL